MKTILIIILVFSVVRISFSQSVFFAKNQINTLYKRKVNQELLKSLINKKSITKSVARKEMNTFKTIPVFSFIVASHAIEYDSKKKIAQYLQPNDIFPFEFAMVFKNNQLHATLDCSEIVNYVRCEICSYSDEKSSHSRHEIEDFLSTVHISKNTFLFTVQFFKNAIWFVEKNDVRVYCMEHNVTYDPDEFISKHYSIETVRGLAQGRIGPFFN